LGSRQEKITIHPTDFVVRDGFLSYNDMQMDIGDSPVNFAGRSGLDESLDMKVTLPYTFEGRTAKTGYENDRRVTVPLKGTLSDPKLALGADCRGRFAGLAHVGAACGPGPGVVSVSVPAATAVFRWLAHAQT